MHRYFNAENSDTSMLADDVVYTVMATGQEARGRQAVLELLETFYQGAFEATAEPRTIIITDGRAAGEWDFVGKHTGEFAGVPATGKEVHVPLCVVYELENDLIKTAHIYFEIPAFLQQVGAK
jgi:steroid delta-isomerase-like uncharacterized protein